MTFVNAPKSNQNVYNHRRPNGEHDKCSPRTRNIFLLGLCLCPPDPRTGTILKEGPPRFARTSMHADFMGQLGPGNDDGKWKCDAIKSSKIVKAPTHRIPIRILMTIKQTFMHLLGSPRFDKRMRSLWWGKPTHADCSPGGFDHNKPKQARPPKRSAHAHSKWLNKFYEPHHPTSVCVNSDSIHPFIHSFGSFP